MRLFVAIHPAPDLLRRLEKAQQILAFASGGGRFPQPGDLHVTLAFLGEQPEARVMDLLEAMEQASACMAETGPPMLTVTDIVAIPGSKGDLWIAELGLDTALAELSRRLGKELRQRGFPVEKRPFRPHVTLGRGLAQLPDPPGTCKSMKDVLRGPASPVQGVSLVQSVLRPSGPLYEELAYIAFPEGRE